MAIRIRKRAGITVALCAAKTKAKKGDVYLHDGIHHALTTKFSVDFMEEGFMNADLADDKIKALMLKMESR